MRYILITQIAILRSSFLISLSIKWLHFALEFANRIRNNSRALQEYKNLEFIKVDNPNIIAYLKRTEDASEIIVATVNLNPFTTEEANIEIPIWKLDIDEDHEYAMRDLLNDDVYKWKGTNNYIKLSHENPAHIFSLRRI